MKILVNFEGKKQVNAHFKKFHLPTDQPMISGGDELAPSPFDVFLSSLATCAGIYVREFCEKREIPTQFISLEQENILDMETKILTCIDLTIFVPSDFPEKYDEAMIHTASLCLVKKQLNPTIKFDITVKRK